MCLLYVRENKALFIIGTPVWPGVLSLSPCGVCTAVWCVVAAAEVLSGVSASVLLCGTCLSLQGCALGKGYLLRACGPMRVLTVVAFLWGGRAGDMSLWGPGV